MINQDYIDLLKKVLIDFHHAEYVQYKPIHENGGWKVKLLQNLNSVLKSKGLSICRRLEPDLQKRIIGEDWPVYADTMIGLKRMENLEYCISVIQADNIPGDIIETGVWRGGACIFMKALLNQYNDRVRNIWLADSFEGLPKPDPLKYKNDAGDMHFEQKELAISLETVKKNFTKYNLLDDQVKFLKGWFKDTLPTAPIEKLAIARLDGDMYESTMDGLVNLYPKLSIGGFIIIDDWGAVKACQDAVIDYRKQHNITEEIVDIDGLGVYWRKQQ